jgi:phosphatidylethanolamine/phosphatidyl-N-methylethanolamine N-methyltransferase
MMNRQAGNLPSFSARYQPSFPHKIPSAYRLFLQQSIRALFSTASVLPSSRFLADALVKPIDFRQARVIVELGPGTGAVTSEILKRMRPDGKLLAIDINRAFIDHLGTACADPRLIPLQGSAAELSSLLANRGMTRVDAVVSSLGLSSMENSLRTGIVREIGRCLVPGGMLTQYQYLGNLDVPRLGIRSFDEAAFLRTYFDHVGVARVIRNFPPAIVFTCRHFRRSGHKRVHVAHA